MPKPNTTFELSINDLDIIETALRAAQHDTEREGLVDGSCINDLLGRLHNQKVFFRPSNGVYVGG